MENVSDVKAIIQDFFTITEVLQRILYFSCILAGFRYKYRETTICVPTSQKAATMKCPACGAIDDKVIDSRLGKDNSVIRRRRQCLNCQKRFTTYERIEEILPYVIKKDGRREPFDRRKIVEGMRRACEKRPISIDRIESVADAMEQELMERPEKEISVQYIGERVMTELQKMDDIAYVLFASVYRSFRDIEEFVREIKELYELKEAREQRRAEPPEEVAEIRNSP
jgi:transcriptional repressor NrdR